MGDWRAQVQIKFSLRGIERECDMSINWDMDSPVDQRVVDFFEEARQAALDKVYEEEWENGEASRQREEEARDRAEFERLKAKFSGTP